jgi:phenylacetate-CoA ligase
MTFTDKMRSHAFWLTDALKGSRVRKHYNDIKLIYENLDSPEVTEKRSKFLFDLLDHAVRSTRFYERFKKFNALTDFPVVNKNTIRINLNDFLSEKYTAEKLNKSVSSGSTGAPFIVFQDMNKRARHHAENIYISDIIRYHLCMRLYCLKVRNDLNLMSPLKKWMWNIVMMDSYDLSDKKMHELINQLLADKSSKSILAFASTLDILSRFIEKSEVQFLPEKVNSVISIGETLPDVAKQILEKSLSCPVICRYSNRENGFLAQQCMEDNNEYHLNLASFHFEMLDPELDKPAKPGEPGRIVVTDLFNYAMPLIRYDTGDMAVLSETSSCGKPGPVFTRIEGRRSDYIYNTSGSMLSPFFIITLMGKYAEHIKQFQFIQNEREKYVMKINSNGLQPKTAAAMIEDIKTFVGPGAGIEIEYVDNIPVLDSGKRKMIINNFKTA